MSLDDAEALIGAQVPERETSTSDTGTVELVTASTLKPVPIRWVWPGWLAAGKLHVLAGAPGCGKTTIGLRMAATISHGGIWPDGTRATLGHVLVWSGEDDPRDTLVPRLLAAGADLSRVHFIGDVYGAEGRRAFDPATDMAALLDAAREIDGLRLLLVDPVVSAVAGDSHKNAEVRRGLQPLVDFGQRVGAAVLGISHFTKGTSGRDPLERVTGSLAFGALARVVLGAAKKQTDDGENARVFVRLKSNIGPDGGGFTYSLEQHEIDGGIIASTADFGEPIEGNAREILADCDAQADSEGGVVADAEGFLRELLGSSRVPAKQVRAEVDDAGHSWASVRRAAQKLGVESVRESVGKNGKGQWVWMLPPCKVLKNSQDAQQKTVSTLQDFEHLAGQMADDDVEIEL